MSKLATLPHVQNAAQAAEDEPKKILIVEPPKGFMYVAVPEDVRRSAITSDGIVALCRMDGGDLAADFTVDMRDLTAACARLHKKGKLTLTIAVEPSSDRRCEISYDISTKPPKEKKHPSSMFLTQKGQLLSRDPEQAELDLKVVQIDPPSAPVRVL